MIKDKKLLILFTSIIVSLFLRELPYINTLFANRIWLFYFGLLFVLFPPKKTSAIFILMIFIWILGIVFSLLNLPLLTDGIGVLVYALLMCIVFLKTISILRTP